MEEKVNNVNVELACVSEKGYELYSPEKLDAIIARLA
jgi:hypothetical protein